MQSKKLHARLAPSRSGKWLNCTASIFAEEAIPYSNEPSVYAEEGTAAHSLASDTLEAGLFVVPEERVGTTIRTPAGLSFIVTEDMKHFVDCYLQRIEEYVGKDGTLLIEYRVGLENVTGEKNAAGTADAIIVRGRELQVHDLKYGMGAVEAQDNTQMIIYALGALELVSDLYDINSVLVKIHQPRISSYPEARYTLAEMKEWRDRIRTQGKRILKIKVPGVDDFSPGEHCVNHYCAARATCSALAEHVRMLTEMKANEVSVAKLGELALSVPLVRGWCEAIESRVESLVLSGVNVVGFKKVLGRQGNRTFTDELLADQKKLNELNLLKIAVKAITEAEKEGIVIPEEYIFRKPARVIVVPVTDKREAIEDDTDDFEVLEC